MSLGAHPAIGGFAGSGIVDAPTQASEAAGVDLLGHGGQREFDGGGHVGLGHVCGHVFCRRHILHIRCHVRGVGHVCGLVLANTRLVGAALEVADLCAGASVDASAGLNVAGFAKCLGVVFKTPGCQNKA